MRSSAAFSGSWIEFRSWGGEASKSPPSTNFIISCCSDVRFFTSDLLSRSLSSRVRLSSVWTWVAEAIKPAAAINCSICNSDLREASLASNFRLFLFLFLANLLEGAERAESSESSDSDPRAAAGLLRLGGVGGRRCVAGPDLLGLGLEDGGAFASL